MAVNNGKLLTGSIRVYEGYNQSAISVILAGLTVYFKKNSDKD
jgi:hypothetical protein